MGSISFHREKYRVYEIGEYLRGGESDTLQLSTITING